jgi:hypothetical protein
VVVEHHSGHRNTSRRVSTWTDQMNTIRATTNSIGAAMRNHIIMSRIAPLSRGGLSVLSMGSSVTVLRVATRNRFTSPVQESFLNVGSTAVRFSFLEGRAGLWQTFFSSAQMPTVWQQTN